MHAVRIFQRSIDKLFNTCHAAFFIAFRTSDGLAIALIKYVTANRALHSFLFGPVCFEKSVGKVSKKCYMIQICCQGLEKVFQNQFLENDVQYVKDLTQNLIRIVEIERRQEKVLLFYGN